MEPTLLAFYQMEDSTVVRVIGRTREKLTLEAFDTGERFGVRREPFETDIRAGYIQRVEPAGWQLVGDGSVEQASGVM